MAVAITTSVQTLYASINIQVVLHTLSMDPPDDYGYMKFVATSHMTVSGGNLTSYSNNITVCSGHSILVIGYGNTLVPNSHHYLTLKNVLHAPKLINSLGCVSKYTIANDISFENIFSFLWMFKHGFF